MLRVNRYVALAFVVTMNTGATRAENHSASFGQYSTAVKESRLFAEKGGATTLRCDLFFSSTGGDHSIVAPKGSVVSQTIPAFVWQYSGLLPVSDYLKTVAIHSISSESMESAWQDVQLAFYNGLRVEGAREMDAKIAYAGAYAFAPRWSLVELIGIADPKKDANSKLYKVKVTPAGTNGMSDAEYRTLAQEILSAPQHVSLQDIRGVIDAAAGKLVTAKAAGASNSGVVVSNKELDKAGAVQESLPQPAAEIAREITTDPLLDDLFIDDSILSVTTVPQGAEVPVESEVVEIPQIDVPVETPAVVTEVPNKAISGPEDPLLVSDAVDEDADESEQRTPVTIDPSLGAQPTVWKTMPDGSVVLVQIEG